MKRARGVTASERGGLRDYFQWHQRGVTSASGLTPFRVVSGSAHDLLPDGLPGWALFRIDGGEVLSAAHPGVGHVNQCPRCPPRRALLSVGRRPPGLTRPGCPRGVRWNRTWGQIPWHSSHGEMPKIFAGICYANAPPPLGLGRGIWTPCCGAPEAASGWLQRGYLTGG